MKEKWYSEGLTKELANSLKMEHAKIDKVGYGDESQRITFDLDLQTESGKYFSLKLSGPSEIGKFFMEITTHLNKSIQGKVIEVFHDGNIIKGISVNKNLI